MTHSTSYLADFIRGITALAPSREEEERIERHSAKHQGPIREFRLVHNQQLDENTPPKVGGKRLPRAA